MAISSHEIEWPFVMTIEFASLRFSEWVLDDVTEVLRFYGE